MVTRDTFRPKALPEYLTLSLRHLVSNLCIRDVFLELLGDKSLDLSRLGDQGVEVVELAQDVRVEHGRCQFMVVVVHAAGQSVVFAFIFRKFQRKWTISRPLSIPL